MSKKVIKKEGHRFGYVFGGVISLLVGALFFILYFPTALNVLFNVEPIWDLTGAIAGLFGDGFVKYVLDLGVPVVLVLTLCTYFVCLVARRSANAEFLRVSALLNVLALTLAVLPNALIALSADLTATAETLTQYFNYAILALWALALIFFIVGIVLRAKQKYHVNRATTTLCFASAFWLLLTAFYALNTIAVLAKLGVNTPIVNICAQVFAITPALLSLFYIAIAIWQFCTVPHRVVLQNDKFVNAAQNKHGGKKPIMLNQNGVGSRYTYEELAEQRKLENEQNARANLKYNEQPYVPQANQNAYGPQNSNMTNLPPNEVPYVPIQQYQQNASQPFQNARPSVNPQQNTPYPNQNPNATPTAPYGNYQTPPNYTQRPINPPSAPSQSGRAPVAPQPKPVPPAPNIPPRPNTLPPRPVQPLPPKIVPPVPPRAPNTQNNPNTGINPNQNPNINTNPYGNNNNNNNGY